MHSYRNPSRLGQWQRYKEYRDKVECGKFSEEEFEHACVGMGVTLNTYFALQRKWETLEAEKEPTPNYPTASF